MTKDRGFNEEEAVQQKYRELVRFVRWGRIVAVVAILIWLASWALSLRSFLLYDSPFGGFLAFVVFPLAIIAGVVGFRNRAKDIRELLKGDRP